MIQRTPTSVLTAGGNALKNRIMASTSYNLTGARGGCYFNNKFYTTASLSGTQFSEIDLVTGNIVKFGNSIGYSGIVAHPNGYLYAVPDTSSYFAKIDPVNHTVVTIGSAATGYYGACLAQNGKIYAAPMTASQFVELDVVTDSILKFGSSSGYIGINLAPNGYLYCIPHSATSIAKINPANRAITFHGSYAGSSKYAGGGVYDDRIYLAPFSATQVAYIDTSLDSIISVGPTLTSTVFTGVQCNVDAVYFINASANQMVKIDRDTNVVTAVGSSVVGSYKYAGGLIDTLGRIFRVPLYATSTTLYPTGHVPPSDAFVIPSNLADLPTSNYNKYFNKF